MQATRLCKGLVVWRGVGGGGMGGERLMKKDWEKGSSFHSNQLSENFSALQNLFYSDVFMILNFISFNMNFNSYNIFFFMLRKRSEMKEEVQSYFLNISKLSEEATRNMGAGVKNILF